MLLRRSALRLVACATVVSGGAVGQEFELPDVNSMLFGPYKRSSRVYLANEDYRGYASYSSKLRLLELKWIYPVHGLTDGPLWSSPELAVSYQSVALPYWPTDVVNVGVDRLAVAGVTPRGRTIIEVRTFENAPTPSLFFPIGGGERIIPEVTVDFTSIDRVLSEDALTFGTIPYIFPNLGDPASIFFMKYEDGDLFDLDLLTGEVHLVASSTATPDVLVEPNLDVVWTSAGAGIHHEDGGIYWLYNPGAPSGQEAHDQILILHDDDLDGTLDGSRLIRRDAWGDYSLRDSWVPRRSR